MKTIFILVVVGVFAIFLECIFVVVPAYFLWQWLAPLFEMPQLDFWQIFGLLVLVRLFFPMSRSSSSKS